jgi:hypothetical protein
LASAKRFRLPFSAPEPQYPGDLMAAFAKDAQATNLRAFVLYLAVIAVGLAVFVVAYPSDSGWALIGITFALIGSLVIPVIPLEIWRRRRGTAVNQLLLGWLDVAFQEWRSVDDQDPPRSPEEGMTRLEGRNDDLATARRVSLLWRNGKPETARAIVDAWQPSNATFRARRERLLSMMEFDSHDTDDLDAATAAANLIEDLEQRETAVTELAIERARRLQAKGEDPFPALVEARRALGPLDLTEVTAMARGSVLRRAGITSLGCVFAVAHFVVVLGLAKLLLALTGN